MIISSSSHLKIYYILRLVSGYFFASNTLWVFLFVCLHIYQLDLRPSGRLWDTHTMLNTINTLSSSRTGAISLHMCYHSTASSPHPFTTFLSSFSFSLRHTCPPSIQKPLEDRKQVFAHFLFYGVFSSTPVKLYSL